jgi:hypothetical protein
MCFFHLGEFTRASVCLKKALIIVNTECQLIHEIAVQEKSVTAVVDNNSDDDDHCDNYNDDENPVGNSSRSLDNSSNYDNQNDDDNVHYGDGNDNSYDEDEHDSNYDCDRIEEHTQLEKNQNMKEKILFYMVKTEKKIEVEKINELKRKKAMQKVFSSTQPSSKSVLRTKEIRGIKKIENAKHHQLKKKAVFTIIVDFIYLLCRFFLSFIIKKKD